MNVVVSTDNSIYKLFELLDKYELATNSKINKDKTEAKWLGKSNYRVRGSPKNGLYLKKMKKQTQK
jgi:hypothetical protein